MRRKITAKKIRRFDTEYAKLTKELGRAVQKAEDKFFWDFISLLAATWPNATNDKFDRRMARQIIQDVLLERVRINSILM
jgi:hypothetical protein